MSVKYARRQRERAFRDGNNDKFMYWSRKVERLIVDLNGTLLLKLRCLDCKQYWKSVKSLANFNSTRCKLKLNGNSEVNTLNEFFLRYEQDVDIKVPNNFKIDNHVPPPILNDFDVIQLMKHSKNKNSRGHDGLSSALLRKFRYELVQPIREILNTCLKLQCIPKCWKKIKILPIPKVSKATINEPRHYRPVGQTPSLLKLLEYCIKQKLESSVTNLDPHQYAYKRNKSMLNALDLVINSITGILDGKHRVARVLLLDYSSAFNTISRQNILNILCNYQVPYWLMNLLVSYMGERQQYTQIGKVKSSEITCKTGVVQGAVLPPSFLH
ncbi:Uncharacterised protein r2_g1816 [Pycnogonum litorale]